MPDRYFLVSSRLGFRAWSQADLPLARALWGNPAVTKFIGGPFSGEQIQYRLSWEIETRKPAASNTGLFFCSKMAAM